MALQIRTTIADPLFQSNCYILYCDETGEGIISDPGKPGSFEDILKEENVTLKAIVNTHAHLDHVLGVAEIKRIYDIPFKLHEDEKRLLSIVNDHALSYGLPEIEVPEVDEWLTDGQKISFGNQSVEVVLTPGHSPGGICLMSPGHVIVGDLIFRGAIGRFDLEGGDHDTLLRSIHERILTLPPDTRLYPGHGPSTTVEREAAENPFLQ